jgi:hypothetical protein
MTMAPPINVGVDGVWLSTTQTQIGPKNVSSKKMSATSDAVM